jgi:hypothetical protein
MTTTIDPETLARAETRVTLDAEEGTGAAALLGAVLALARPSLRTAIRLAPGQEICLGGPGECHRRAQYAVTGSVSGWAYVVTPEGGVALRTYSGECSDFPDHHRPRRHDRPATIIEVVTETGYVGRAPATAAAEAITEIARAVGRVADERGIVTARRRVAQLRAALVALGVSP